MADAEQIAQAFHEAYERLSPRFGSGLPWADVPENYRASLTKAIQELLDHGVIMGGSAAQEPSDEDRIRSAMAEAQDHPGRVITR